MRGGLRVKGERTVGGRRRGGVMGEGRPFRSRAEGHIPWMTESFSTLQKHRQPPAERRTSAPPSRHQRPPRRSEMHITPLALSQIARLLVIYILAEWNTFGLRARIFPFQGSAVFSKLISFRFTLSPNVLHFFLRFLLTLHNYLYKTW